MRRRKLAQKYKGFRVSGRYRRLQAAIYLFTAHEGFILMRRLKAAVPWVFY